jgi:hypothetical protein
VCMCVYQCVCVYVGASFQSPVLGRDSQSQEGSKLQEAESFALHTPKPPDSFLTCLPAPSVAPH